MLELTGTRDLALVERRLAAASRVPIAADAVYLLARSRFLETVRIERATARAAS